MENPYLNQSQLNLPLQIELCQEIHSVALQTATRSLYAEDVPAYLDLVQLARVRSLIGADVYLFHPNYVAEIFSGVNLAHYEAIEHLYCSRIRRSIKMIHRIMSKMAEAVDTPPITYESIWSICLYLDEKRQENTAMTISRTEAIWQLVLLHPQVIVKRDGDSVFSPQIICIIEMEPATVLSYRVTDQESIRKTGWLAIYDALVSTRRPSTLAATGLEWYLPFQLNIEAGLELKVETVLYDNFGVVVKQKTLPSNLLDALRSGWEQDLVGQVLAEGYFDRVFDNYLHRIHGYGPKRARADLSREYSSLIGYNRDPTWQFPALRQLLPEHEGVISPQGAVEYDRLHYEDPLLKYWPGERVSLRQSEHTEANAWIYLDNDILCLAGARELRRSDGTYRLKRFQRG